LLVVAVTVLFSELAGLTLCGSWGHGQEAASESNILGNYLFILGRILFIGAGSWLGLISNSLGPSVVLALEAEL
jgi:hypothetical protein